MNVGDLMMLRYGNGTQIARVREVTSRGGYKIDRFHPNAHAHKGVWIEVKSTLAADDRRILGPVPGSDPRRGVAGFGPTLNDSIGLSCKETLVVDNFIASLPESIDLQEALRLRLRRYR